MSVSINAMERAAKIPQRTVLRNPVNRNTLKPIRDSKILKDYDFTPEMSQADPNSQGTKEAARDILGGMAIGAGTGAAVGSVVPVVGTAAGALVGAFVGTVGGTIKCFVDIFREK